MGGDGRGGEVGWRGRKVKTFCVCCHKTTKSLYLNLLLLYTHVFINEPKYFFSPLSDMLS